LFACHLIRQIRRRTDLIKILNAVRAAVENESRNEQVPYIEDSGEEPLHLSYCKRDGNCEPEESSSRPATSLAYSGEARGGIGGINPRLEASNIWRGVQVDYLSQTKK
jgi:hypothetical protein